MANALKRCPPTPLPRDTLTNQYPSSIPSAAPGNRHSAWPFHSSSGQFKSAGINRTSRVCLCACCMHEEAFSIALDLETLVRKQNQSALSQSLLLCYCQVHQKSGAKVSKLLNKHRNTSFCIHCSPVFQMFYLNST